MRVPTDPSGSVCGRGLGGGSRTRRTDRARAAAVPGWVRNLAGGRGVLGPGTGWNKHFEVHDHVAGLTEHRPKSKLKEPREFDSTF